MPWLLWHPQRRTPRKRQAPNDTPPHLRPTRGAGGVGDCHVGCQAMAVTITVYGNPAPKGSKRFVGLSKTGRGILIESSKREKPWAEAVKWAAVEFANNQKPYVPGVLVRGPVAVTMTFTMPKPKSAPKNRRTWPDRKPDVDKLVRSTCDALVAGGVFEDDARIVHLTALKVFPGEIFPDHPAWDGLELPGCQIRVEAVI